MLLDSIALLIFGVEWMQNYGVPRYKKFSIFLYSPILGLNFLLNNLVPGDIYLSSSLWARDHVLYHAKQ